MKMGFKSFFRDFKNWFRRIRKLPQEEALELKNPDIHRKLMQAYPEVPEWWVSTVTRAGIHGGSPC